MTCFESTGFLLDDFGRGWHAIEGNEKGFGRLDEMDMFFNDFDDSLSEEWEENLGIIEIRNWNGAVFFMKSMERFINNGIGVEKQMLETGGGRLLGCGCGWILESRGLQ